MLTVQALPGSLGHDFGQGQTDLTAQRRPGSPQAQSRDKTTLGMDPAIITQSTREIPSFICFTVDSQSLEISKARLDVALSDLV